VQNVYNEVKNYFEEVGPQQTRYSTDNYFRFSGVMKLFAFFMQSAFKKTSQDYLNRFKAFAESQ
jgi:hypothetical protein